MYILMLVYTMNTQTEPILDMRINAALKKLARTKCQCCNKTAIDDEMVVLGSL